MGENDSGVIKFHEKMTSYLDILRENYFRIAIFFEEMSPELSFFSRENDSRVKIFYEKMTSELIY